MHRHRVSSQRSFILAARAAEMRSVPTATEALLFEALRGNRLGVAFRRQMPLLGKYIGDLYAPALKLVVEIDGGYHASAARRRADARRDRALRNAGYRVLRVDAALVQRDLRAAVGLVHAAFKLMSPT